MFEIFKSELTRYQKWAWLWALLLLAAFGFISKQKPLLEHHIAQSLFNNLLLIGGSFCFGLLQMLLHKRKNHWTFLIHRPVNLSKIYLGLLFVGLVVIFIAVAFPWLIATMGIDISGTYIVDTRHYSYIVYLFLTCVLAYQLGQFIILNASWGAISLVAIMVVVLAPIANSTLAQFGPVIIFNVILLYLNLRSFKPDLSTFLRRPLDILLISVPMSFCLSVILLVLTSVFYHIPNFILGTHPDFAPPKDVISYLYRVKNEELLPHLLKDSNHPQKSSLVAQAKLADTVSFKMYNQKEGRLGQLYVDDVGSRLSDTSDTEWLFSHDLGLILPNSKQLDKNTIAIGKNGFIEDFRLAKPEDKFDEVPWLAPNHYVTKQSLVWVDFEQEYIQTRFTLEPNEFFMTMPRQNNGYTYLVTNQRIVLFTNQAYLDQYTPLQSLVALPHPVPIEQIWGANAVELPQGFAMMYYGRDYFGLDKPAASVILSQFDGGYTPIAETRFTPYIYPKWVMYFDYLISPVLYFGRASLFDLLSTESGAVMRHTDLKKPFANYPSSINTAAFVLHLISLALGLFFMRFHKLSNPTRLVWLGLFVVFSLPAVVSFLFLNPFVGVYRRRKTPEDKLAVTNLSEVTTN